MNAKTGARSASSTLNGFAGFKEPSSLPSCGSRPCLIQPDYNVPAENDSINYLLCFVLEPCRLYLGYAGNLGEKARVGMSM